MQGNRKSLSWVRRYKWLLLIIVVIGLVALHENKPKWYWDEAATMEEIALLVDGPVAFERFVGWSWAPHVTTVLLPPCKLDVAKTRHMAELLRALPELERVIAHYVRGQSEAMDLLQQELEGHAFVEDGLFSTTVDLVERQGNLCVAGMYNYSGQIRQ